MDIKQILLIEDEIANICRVSLRTVRRWRMRRVGPAFIKVAGGPMVRYRQSDFQVWLKAHPAIGGDDETSASRSRAHCHPSNAGNSIGGRNA